MNNLRVPTLQLTYLIALLSSVITLCLLWTKSGSLITVATLAVAIAGWSIILFSSIRTKRKINKIVNDVFGSNASSDVISIYNWLTGRYVGIDKATGNILVIALNKKGRKIFGFDYQIWDGYEVCGNKLTFKFNNLDLPSLEINDAAVTKFKHKLDVLLSNVFQKNISPNKNFSTVVERVTQAV
ncbi:hypothetical protein EOU36_23085 [Salmonella enterica]|nr:hypothetical protein [Salmonella enterica]EBY3326955.1 hypothetical protein [Salmonella enterica subsp. enterica serovar Java]MKZ22546.1 hypothetical protein [Salmonella enterica subsp. enterica serovar Enteritidis]EAM7141165.1 hypothetical protein [Salmonella enterica]EAN2734893.1 hypothetical protein [Salmonella enterica]